MFHLPFDIYPLMRPFVFLLDPEVAHTVAVACIKARLIPVPKVKEDPVLRTPFGGMDFPHPIGLAAGFDKQASFIEPLFSLGFSSIEVGGVTPFAQPGNPKPRMFRIAESKAIINRFNLNSIGFDAFEERLKNWHAKAGQKSGRMVGVNVAKGDVCTDDAEAYVLGLKKFAPYVKFVTLNVSCPNAPDACQLEGRDQLKALLERVKTAHQSLETKPLLFLKISPDQTEKQAKDIAEVVLSVGGVDGLIVSNTTATRPASVTSPLANERGGLSGKPLFEMSTKLLGTLYQLTEGKIPLIGSGGVFTGADAYAKIRAGASLVQVYTAMVFVGPYVVQHIANELAALLKRDGFASVADAVGADFRK